MTVTDVKLFENYHKNLMNSEDIDAFERRIESDRDFALHYENYLDVLDSLELANNDRIASKTSKIQNSEKWTNRIGVRGIMSMAASLAAIFVISYVLIFSSGKNSSLFDNYFSVYEETNTHLSSEKLELDNCINSYNEQQYNEAISCLAGLEMRSEVHFYLAMSHLNLDHLEKAKDELLKVENLASEKLDEANWYLSLIYLKEGNNLESTIRLKNILNNPNGNYKKQSAKELLNKIK